MTNDFQIENRVPAPVFLRTLARHNPEFFFLADYFLQVEQKIGRYFLNYLGREAHELETVLDNAEVFTNELFFFRELVAGIRWFCLAAITLEEGVISRYPTRRLQDNPEQQRILLEEAGQVLDYLYRAIANLCGRARETADAYGIRLPGKSTVSNYIKFQGRMLLEKNRVPVSLKTPLDAVEIVATEFLSVSESLKRYKAGIERGGVKINEKDINQVLSGLHTLQSFYDSHIHETVIESKEPDFWTLRGYIGIALRLAELVRDLSHFYERHLLTNKDKTIRENMAALVEEETLVGTITGFGLERTGHYVADGADLAMKLLTRCTGRVRRAISIPLGVDGIHARPMTWIHLISRKFGHVVFEVGGEKFEADSMLSLLTMAEGIDRAIGLEDRESQIAVATGTVINELETREKPILAGKKVFHPASLISALESFRDDLRKKAGTRYVEIIATGPEQAIRHIEIMAGLSFRKEQFPEELSYLSDRA